MYFHGLISHFIVILNNILLLEITVYLSILLLEDNFSENSHAVGHDSTAIPENQEYIHMVCVYVCAWVHICVHVYTCIMQHIIKILELAKLICNDRMIYK